MTIEEHGVSAITVGDLLTQNLRIPHYQRPYSWEPATALQLLEDIRESLDDGDREGVPYVLGAVILHEDGDRLDVVDGQQRLLTLRMLTMQLSEEPAPTSFTGDNPISRVWTALHRRTGTWDDQKRGEVLNFIHTQCQLVRIVTDDVDEAFRVFDSQNYRGKPLAPHDLLKAHHLREMRDETDIMKSAVVEVWESVRDEDLDRLFSTYLYRIARWSRGTHAPAFTSQGIGIFKGISPARDSSPNSRYHLAAQAAIPMLTAWEGPGSGSRNARRARFQLDAPLAAGRPFFEMVTFMLDELNHLASEAFMGDLANFALYDLAALEDSRILRERASQNRYRYVSELYLAAYLYYVNKFGTEDAYAARHQLFAWAFSLRVDLSRVQFRSIDNRACSEGSAFTLFRNALSGRSVHQLVVSSTPYSDSHETKLVTVLKELGA